MSRTTSHPAQNRQRAVIIALMVIAISGLHLFVSRDFEKGHIVARELYFLPIILSVFWFGLRGAVITALTVTIFYLGYSASHWRGFTPDDLDRLLEIGLFNVVAVVTGLLQDRQRAQTREKLEAVRALAGTVAHEMNSPLFVAMGTLELLQDDFTEDSQPYREMAAVLDNLAQLKTLIKKISQIKEVVTRDYDGSSRIVDLERSLPDQ